MIEIQEWFPSEDDVVMTISEWEECVRDGLFMDYDGYGCFCNPEMKTELFGFDVYPSMLSSVDLDYERLKTMWTHINWFNR